MFEFWVSGDIVVLLLCVFFWIIIVVVIVVFFCYLLGFKWLLKNICIERGLSFGIDLEVIEEDLFDV